MDGYGHAIGYNVLARGTPVRSSDGVQVGTVRRVQDNAREHIFDGIVIDTRDGQRFVDAPEVARASSAVGKRMRNATTTRRMKRFGQSMRDRWDRR